MLKMVLRYAGLAEEKSLDLFCTGCEFPMKGADPDLWRQLIRKVREVYTDPLTYAANYNKKAAAKDAEGVIKSFWV